MQGGPFLALANRPLLLGIRCVAHRNQLETKLVEHLPRQAARKSVSRKRMKHRRGFVRLQGAIQIRLCLQTSHLRCRSIADESVATSFRNHIDWKAPAFAEHVNWALHHGSSLPGYQLIFRMDTVAKPIVLRRRSKDTPKGQPSKLNSNTASQVWKLT